MAADVKSEKNESRVKPVLIENELKESFLDYAMSVVVSRAIPDIRDGLKPVHRRILYTMHQLGFVHNRPYHKSVRVVGDVLGKYHPHGDQALYNAMVGLVQKFTKRYPLLDGQGNWGSVDGDNAAAMRYTEIRMKKIAQELLADLDKQTVPFVPNFDESTVEPVVLPSRLPNLLINGTSGIAVGMATSIPPHNLGEVVSACLTFLDNHEITDDELLEIVPGPDFPTGAIICGRAGIVRAYKTGRGNAIVRGQVNVEETKKGDVIIITELPYLVNKADLIVKMADLVKNKVLEGISNIRDESDKKGIRIVVELKRGEMPSVIINHLYKYTQLQTSVSILMLGLLNNKPMIFSLKDLIREFVLHRQEVVYRRTLYDLAKAKDRDHLLAGFIIALENIDEVVALIKGSSSAQDAISQLNKRFLFSREQCVAILEMRLQRLTGLERDKIHAEKEELKRKIAYLQQVLAEPDVLKEEVKKELQELKETYADDRKTRIEGPIDILTEADLIPEEDVVVTLTRKGYMKRVPLSVYGVQHRGGKGKMSMTSLQDSDDIVQDIFVATSHDELLFFTNLGRVYKLQVFEIPEGSRTARGRAVVNLLPLTEGERVVKLLPAPELHGKLLVMVTRGGVIKRVDAESFEKVRVSGVRAVTLPENDELAFCSLSSGDNTVVLATAHGQGIRFKEDEVRVMGRQATGVRGIRLKKNDYVVGMEVIDGQEDILFATQYGYGKRVKAEDFRVAHRGGYGVRTIPTDERNGLVIGLVAVTDQSTVLLIDEYGKMIRLSPQEIRTMGRQAKGVRLIRLEEEQRLASVTAFAETEQEEEALSDDAELNKSSHEADSLESVDDVGALSSDDVHDEQFEV